MPEKHLYEYAVIRIVPKVEREEFVNTGIILFSKKAKYIRMLYAFDENRLGHFCSELDLDAAREALIAFEKIANGDKDGGAIARLDIPERFRWLTAVKSACIQTSRPHPGFSENLDDTARCLFKELVL
ncbi:DUF3037 domain-containing protein [Dysgonomonas macrotermitis]|uniref:DUF3037 domain-containing protein n=1 Tax=Dysgonomonas macrotermitis TaxID=1346286 RepID=A0A1M5FM56_9BACT|nr:DUF3037 domain-containing protein [Dysgonomonas macrotermitis]SHF92576.1 Protein of unknown function [Dysgonomonas macrotermitis]